MNADGSGVTQLTSGSYKDSHPAWSRDGSRIAFVSDRDWVGNSTEIYVMNADGSGVTLFADSAANRPAWFGPGAPPPP